MAHSSLSNKEIDYDLAKKVVKERLGSKVISDLRVEDIIQRVSETTHIKERDIIGSSRKMEIAEARQISIYLCREILGTPLVTIGMHFGGRDHSTVLHACRVIGNKDKKRPTRWGLGRRIKKRTFVRDKLKTILRPLLPKNFHNILDSSPHNLRVHIHHKTHYYKKSQVHRRKKRGLLFLWYQ